MITLKEYIAKVYHGSQADFARAEGIPRQQVTRWLAGGWVVDSEGQCYRPVRKLNRVEKVI